jgi:hypothetical protein
MQEISFIFFKEMQPKVTKFEKGGFFCNTLYIGLSLLRIQIRANCDGGGREGVKLQNVELALQLNIWDPLDSYFSVFFCAHEKPTHTCTWAFHEHSTIPTELIKL